MTSPPAAAASVSPSCWVPRGPGSLPPRWPPPTTGPASRCDPAPTPSTWATPPPSLSMSSCAIPDASDRPAERVLELRLDVLARRWRHGCLQLGQLLAEGLGKDVIARGGHLAQFTNMPPACSRGCGARRP